jgi:hypothetical protein
MGLVAAEKRLKEVAQTHDPLQLAANRLAFFVGSSQLFYPLGVVWMVGSAGWGAALVWLTTPLFLAVPFVGHRSAGAGRLLLIFAGTLVTLFVGIRLGPETLVEVYDLPLVLAAVGLFRADEQRLRLAALAMPAVELLIVHASPWHPDWIADGEMLWVIHMAGAGVLSLLIAHHALVCLRRSEGSGADDRNRPLV